jgi:hypothetical protein
VTKTKPLNAGASSKKTGPQHLYIMVTQRLQEGVGAGPIHVTKKVLQDVASGSTTKRVRVPVVLDHKLSAGTGALTPSDRRAFAEQGLSAPEIAYVESKLQEKKLKSDAHQAAFEAGRAPRLRAKLKQRLLDQVTADPQLTAEVLASLRRLVPTDGTHNAPVLPQRPPTLSEKVSALRGLLAEVSGDIEAYKDGAKVGKTYDQEKLRSMLSADATREWKLSWFAFSQMIDQATGTPFARPRGWASNAELSKLAAAHGYKSGA